MARPRKDHSKVVAREVARVCASLRGCVRLEPYSDAGAGTQESALASPPVPLIVVLFRPDMKQTIPPETAVLLSDEKKKKARISQPHANITTTNSNTNPKGSPTNAANAPSTTNPTSASSAFANTKGENVVLQAVRAKLEAVCFLAVAASSAEFSWRGNPRFWLHVLSEETGTLNCEPFFDLPRLKRRSSMAFTSEPPACAPATDVHMVTELPEFLLDFSQMQITPALLALCAQTLSSSPVLEPQSEFHPSSRVTWSRRKQLTTPGVSKTASKTKSKLAVTIGLRLECCQVVGTSLRGLKAVLEATCSHPREPHSTANARGGIFKLKRLELMSTVLSGPDLADLAEVLSSASNCSFQDLSLHHMLAKQTSAGYMTQFSQLLTAFFDLRATVSAESTRSFPLKRLSLEDNELSHTQLASLFSAVRASGPKAVRELSLAGCFQRPDVQDTMPWKWIAFGIFHRSSRSRLDRLNLSSNVLRHEDVAAVEKVLASESVGSELLRKPQQCEKLKGVQRSTCTRRALIAARSRLEWPRDHKLGQKPETVTIPSDQWFELLERQRVWSIVLEPGHGQLWVRSCCIKEVEVHPATSEQQPRARNLQALAMNGIKTVGTDLRESRWNRDIVGRMPSMQPLGGVLTAWVRAVGSSLQTLELRCNPGIQDMLVNIFQTCPQLLHLDLENCELTQVSAVTEAFQNDQCRLRSLNLADNDINPDSQLNLARVLRNVSCPAARELYTLHLDNNPTGHENSVAKGLRAMLRTNKTLRLLTLTLDTKRDAQGLLRYNIEKRHSNEWLGCEALSLKHRLALLSVPIVTALPMDSLRLVFRFASRNIHRQILWK